MAPFRQTWVAIVPKITSVPSIIGSCWIINHVRHDQRKRENTHHRLLVAMCVYDIIFSLAILLGTIASPRDPNQIGTFGNATTCTIQGFFTLIGGVVPIYNAFLGINAVLSVGHDMTVKQSRTVECAAHAFIFTCAMSGSIVSVITGSINPTGGWCWLRSVPERCVITGAVCVRGEYAHYISFLYSFMCIVLSFIIAAFSVVNLYIIVYHGEKSSARDQTREEDVHKRSERVAKQAFLYLTAFFLSYFFIVASEIFEYFKGQINATYYVGRMLYPMQGFFNFLVFCSSLPATHSSGSDVRSRIRKKSKFTTISFSEHNNHIDQEKKMNDHPRIIDIDSVKFCTHVEKNEFQHVYIDDIIDELS